MAGPREERLKFVMKCGDANGKSRNFKRIKDPLKQLKDLNLLKNQLEEIQRRVQTEVSSGIPQGSSVFGSPFLKGFLAGYVVAKLRSSAFLGLLLGTVSGIYAAQNYQVPNIERTVKETMNNMKKGPK